MFLECYCLWNLVVFAHWSVIFRVFWILNCKRKEWKSSSRSESTYWRIEKGMFLHDSSCFLLVYSIFDENSSFYWKRCVWFDTFMFKCIIFFYNLVFEKKLNRLVANLFNLLKEILLLFISFYLYVVLEFILTNIKALKFQSWLCSVTFCSFDESYKYVCMLYIVVKLSYFICQSWFLHFLCSLLDPLSIIT